jgi:hypothetical protein
MRLVDLTREIERSTGAVTALDLAARLDTTPAAVDAMLAALRAAGKLSPDGRPQQPSDECPFPGSCSAACPGPASCPFVVDVGDRLEIRRH